jgi:iron complex outermembrane receptor protein
LAVDFTPKSFSAGAVWDFAEGYNLGVSYIYAERAPSSAELFSFGPHIGTQTYEIGALYQLDEDGFEAVDTDFQLETSNNIDISLRKFAGDFGFTVNVFYNDIEDYYYGAETGLFAEFEHEHGDEDAHSDHMDDEHGHDEHEHEHSEEGHSDELPVINFVNSDAILFGAELQLNYQASDALTFTAQGDFINTKVDTEEGVNDLPRTPPSRFMLGAQYSVNNWFVDARITRVSEQSEVAQFETSTSGYTMIDANISYYTSIQGYDIEVFASGRNLTNQEARVHTSFLKNLAPLPGRAVVLGVRANF